MILGLDLGLSLGWALGHHGTMASGIADVRPGQGKPRALRYALFREFVEGVMVNPSNPAKVSLVVYEQPFIRNTQTRTLMYAFTSRIHELCAIHDARYLQVHPLTLKKFTTGHGRAKKAGMYRSAREHGWFDGQHQESGEELVALSESEIDELDKRWDITNNQVDAICLARYGARYGPVPERWLGFEGFDARPPREAREEQKREEAAWARMTAMWESADTYRPTTRKGHA